MEACAAMSLQPFNGADSTPITSALEQGHLTAEIASVIFRAKVPPLRSLDPGEQWLRLKTILGCQPVYEALHISSLPVDVPAQYFYSKGLETIGTLANLLMRGGIDDGDAALALSKDFLDSAFLHQYDTAEAYSCCHAWCKWFVGDGILDETVLLGNRYDWWLLAVTGTD